MKKLVLSLAMILGFASVYGQQTRDLEDINEDNSWLKVGLNVGVPIGDIADYTSFAVGIDLAGQFMRTDNFGLGVASGYTQYVKKSDTPGAEGFGVIPLGLVARYYPESSGIFVGTDLGYSFYTGSTSSNGGMYIRPQVGYHNYDWNIFAFYNQIFSASPMMDVQSIGVAATYNIRFK